MESISIRERFRPARIAFVIPQDDASALEHVVGMNTVLLGGMYNPIIPYSTDRQPEAIAMLRAFDPDLVHHEALQDDSWVPEEFRCRYPRHYSTLYHPTSESGSCDFLYQDVTPIYYYLWREITRIEEKPPFFLPIVDATAVHHLLYKVIFGTFPTDFKQPYERLFRDLNPRHESFTDLEPLNTLDPWQALSPLRTTIHLLETFAQRPTNSERIVFAGDPMHVDSLVDFWNLRAAGNEVLFVPLSHFSKFGENIKDLCRAEHRVRGWEYVPLIFSRTTDDTVKTNVVDWFSGLFSGQERKPAVDRISQDYWNCQGCTNRYYYDEIAETIAPVSNGTFQYQTEFPAWLRTQERTYEERFIYIDPVFYGVQHNDNRLATFPRDPGIEDGLRKWCPRYARITNVGLTMLRSPLHRHVHVSLPTGQEVIEAIFRERGLEIRQSQPGHVAKHLISRLGGISRCRVFKVKAVREVLELMNDRDAHPHNEILGRLGAHLSATPTDLFIDGKLAHTYNAPQLLDMMYRKSMVQQGWRLQCRSCSLYEWYSVEELSNEYRCRWCFETQQTPQLVKNPSVTFAYRANGLYLAPGKQKGSVPVILTLWRLLDGLGGPSDGSVYCTSTEVWNPADRTILGEVDFVVLVPRGEERLRLVIGEARGLNDLAEEDIRKLLGIAQEFGDDSMRGCIVFCFSTLKDVFSDDEKKLLRKIVESGHEVIPLTRLDLDPYDLHDRFEGLANPRYHMLRDLAANLRELNLAK